MTANNSIKNEKLGKYYIEMKKHIKKPKSPYHKIDENGIILYKIPYTDKYEYYPVSIALYAMGNYEAYLDSKKKEYKKNFLKQVNWLSNNIKIKSGNLGVWEHDYVLPYYNFTTPWVHGMAQGLSISALLRAYQMTKKQKYIKNAEKAYNAFNFDIDKGGVKFVDNKGDIWLEEYAILPPPHVLNGFIFILFGIYDFYQVTKDKNVQKFFNKITSTIEKNLEKYDLCYWSKYNLIHSQPATKDYHILHIKQLNALYKITKKEIFKKYANKWEKNLNRPISKIKVFLKRNIMLIKQHGIKESISRYLQIKKWKRN